MDSMIINLYFQFLSMCFCVDFFGSSQISSSGGNPVSCICLSTLNVNTFHSKDWTLFTTSWELVPFTRSNPYWLCLCVDNVSPFHPYPMSFPLLKVIYKQFICSCVHFCLSFGFWFCICFKRFTSSFIMLHEFLTPFVWTNFYGVLNYSS